MALIGGTSVRPIPRQGVEARLPLLYRKARPLAMEFSVWRTGPIELGARRAKDALRAKGRCATEETRGEADCRCGNSVAPGMILIHLAFSGWIPDPHQMAVRIAIYRVIIASTVPVCRGTGDLWTRWTELYAQW
ncbi:hypothetical protein AMJ71_05305 [candidate division TA06 bacterium SM1_40]|uniref:Uncharacterized protein n=1 Tax=candidate division TA06 bacterium SM1_40 TaxID=1703773 RepID=A0A0S8JJI1_UNCT6|nr:MAG: hypothetical protein AMJ71_05305 [candidate division TA06 bacterium SM1_40]